MLRYEWMKFVEFAPERYDWAFQVMTAGRRCEDSGFNRATTLPNGIPMAVEDAADQTTDVN